VRFAILIALGLVFAAGLGIGVQAIARDGATPPRTQARDTANRDERTRRKTPRNTATAEAKRPRVQVTAPVDHRGREGIEEAEIDSHESASRSDG
jgi:hypothetical protein